MNETTKNLLKLIERAINAEEGATDFHHELAEITTYDERMAMVSKNLIRAPWSTYRPTPTARELIKRMNRGY